MKVTVHLADPEETVIVDVDGRDRRAAEMSLGRILGRPASVPWVDLLQTAPETALAWQAWHAARRTGEPFGSADWQTAEARILELEIDPADETAGEILPDPTKPAA